MTQTQKEAVLLAAERLRDDILALYGELTEARAMLVRQAVAHQHEREAWQAEAAQVATSAGPSA